MALLLSESFGFSPNAADYIAYGAITYAGPATAIALTLSSGGPYGDNYLVVSTTYSDGIGFTLPNVTVTGFFGARVSGTGGYMWPLYDVNGVMLLMVVCSNTGVISAYAGGFLALFGGYSTGTLLGTTTSPVITPPTAWAYVEIGWVIGTTTGVLTVRVNNTIVLTVTGANTAGSTTTNAAVAVVGYVPGESGGASAVGITHVYICDNTGPAPNNNFLGDSRGVRCLITANDAINFSANGVAVNATGIATTGRTYALAANTIGYQRIRVSPGGVLLTTDMVLVTGFTGHAMMNVYADNGLGTGPSGAPLATSVVVTNPSVGTVTFTFSGGPHLTSGSYYWAAILTDTAATWQETTLVTFTSYSTQSRTYSLGLPTSPTAGTLLSSASYVDIVTIPSNADIMASYPPNPTTSYTADNTVGAQDTFSIAGPPTAVGQIFAVNVKVLVTKSDPGVRTIQPVLKSNSVVSLGAAQAATATAQQINTIYPLDPNTDVAWTLTGVDAAKPGYKVSG